MANVLEAVSRVYEGNFAVGVRLSNGEWYKDIELVIYLKSGNRIIGLGHSGSRLVGADGVFLSDLGKEQVTGVKVALNDDFRVVQKFSIGGSNGDLVKWLVENNVSRFFVKGRKNDKTFEPEVEACVYELAQLFGIRAIEYKLMVISEFDNKPVCISEDYSEGYTTVSLFHYVESCTNAKIATLHGIEKLELVLSTLPIHEQILHINTLYLDYITGNKDRHLRNFDVRILNSEFLGTVGVFDNGAALFSDESVEEIVNACKAGNNFVKAKPYNSVQRGQLELLKSLGYECTLNYCKKEDIYRIINKYFEGDRAHFLGKYVVQNVERLGLLL